MSNIVWHSLNQGEQEIIMELSDKNLPKLQEQSDIIPDKDSGFCQVSPSTSSQQTQRPPSQDSTGLSVGPVSIGGGGLHYATTQNLENEMKFNNEHLCSTPGGRSVASTVDKSAGTLIYHGLTYRIETISGCIRKTKSHKCIINNISGKFQPGMNAILGPTGSGKSTMLDCLAGRKDPSCLYGRVLVNGSPQPHNFKCMVGYVVQDDVLMGMLTVRENIAFSAALRLPSSVSKKEKSQRVSELIEDLGLTKCADTKVGTPLKRGISGGEMKRTSIAMEMITLPSVLFLDEPTTGLDAYTAHSVMHLLQKLGGRGKTIIFSIHQPRYSIYKLFDTVTLLSGGECVYHGSTEASLNYFQDLGYVCEDHNNPSDFLLDIVSGAILPSSSEDEESPKRNGNGVHYNSEDEELMLDIEPSPENDDYVVSHQKVLVDNFRNSSAFQKLQDGLKTIAGNSTVAETKKTKKRQRIKYPNSYLMQLFLVCERTFKNMIRNPHTLATQALSAAPLGMLVGFIYFQVDDSFSSGIQNRVGAFFFIMMNFVFGNMAAVDLFIKERVLFKHESVGGFYRVSVYFVAKLLCDVLPVRAIPIAIFASITYWMIGLQRNILHFLFFTLNIFLTSTAGTSVALLMSASFSNHSVATILTALVWVLMMIFSGLLVNINTISPVLRWLKWTSIFRYSMNALTINELKDTQMCDFTSSSIGNTTSMCDTGNAYMHRQGIPYDSMLDLWINEIALVIIASVFLVLAYIQLKRASKPR